MYSTALRLQCIPVLCGCNYAQKALAIVEEFMFPTAGRSHAKSTHMHQTWVMWPQVGHITHARHASGGGSFRLPPPPPTPGTLPTHECVRRYMFKCGYRLGTLGRTWMPHQVVLPSQSLTCRTGACWCTPGQLPHSCWRHSKKPTPGPKLRTAGMGWWSGRIAQQQREQRVQQPPHCVLLNMSKSDTIYSGCAFTKKLSCHVRREPRKIVTMA
jgi:hypothetical protein